MDICRVRGRPWLHPRPVWGNIPQAQREAGAFAHLAASEKLLYNEYLEVVVKQKD
jgi:hypothetical protein